MSDCDLRFKFREHEIPVSYLSSISADVAELALKSTIFNTWVERCEKEEDGKRIELHSVEIQHVDMFGPRVGFIKINANSTLVDGYSNTKNRLPGICFLRGGSVSILLALICHELDDQVFSLLVEQPRVPIGAVNCLELPAGMVDDENDQIAGVATREMEEECGIKLRPSELTNLTSLAGMAGSGVCPSPGGCDEDIRYFYAERSVSKTELEQMRGRLAGLRDHGEYITLRVVPLKDIWRESFDNKAICSLFLLNQLRLEGFMPPSGGLLAQPRDPFRRLSDKRVIPILGFGLYKVPTGTEGVTVVTNAISKGYRHFDGASIYKNEYELGQAVRLSGIPREEFFISSKIWNNAQKEGTEGVRTSVEQSLRNLKCGYIDLMYVHWPVPGHFVDTYIVLQEYYKRGLIRNIGLSNFGITDFEELINADGIHVKPAVNQIEISPFMYRADTIEYFQSMNIQMVASKALHRAVDSSDGLLSKISSKYRVSTAQLLLRWGIQKGFVVLSKTTSAERLFENRQILCFKIAEKDILELDRLTSKEQIAAREALEVERRSSV